MLSIDGSFGEGGGQILRTSLGLSVATGQPIEIFNIRANRPTAGLKPQHVSAIEATAYLSEAKVDGLFIGSTRIVFQPRGFRNTKLQFDIGTAGSITLLLQALIPALSKFQGTFEINVKGGTDVKWSPASDYMKYVVLPAYSLMGLELTVNIAKRGFFPVGGGEVSCSVISRGSVKPIKLISHVRGGVGISSICSNLPKSIADRQLKAAEDFLSQKGIQVKTRNSSLEPAISPGTAICIYHCMNNESYIGADSLGKRAKPSEKVGIEAASMFFEEYSSECALDSHLADMVVPLLALAEQESVFTTTKQTSHLVTNLQVAETITGCKYSMEPLENGAITVRMVPRSK